VEFDSNVNVESDPHPPKHNLPRIVTEEGIQIDLSDEQHKNARFSIRSRMEFDSNVNVESDSQRAKQNLQRLIIPNPILKSDAKPKYRITEIPSESRRKSSQTENCEFPSAIVTVVIPLLMNAEPSIT
jgi:hypothetical protein